MEEVLRYLTVKREEGDIAPSQPSAAPEQEGRPYRRKIAEEKTALNEEAAGPEEKE